MESRRVMNDKNEERAVSYEEETIEHKMVIKKASMIKAHERRSQ